MLRSFPEIDSFFSQEYFTQSQLDAFVITLEKAYTDPEVLKKAKELIDLKKLYYQLAPQEKQNEKSNADTILDSDRLKKRNKDLSRFRPYGKGEEEIHVLYWKTVKQIAAILEVKVSFLISLYKQKGLDIPTDLILDKPQVRILEDYFINRIKRLRAIKKQKSLEKAPPVHISKRKESTTTIKAYDELKTHGMSKLIYIRKK